MKTFIIALAALLVLAVVTCPNREEHSQSIMNELNTEIKNGIHKDLDADDEFSMAIGILGTSIGSGIAEYVLDELLTVDNYFVCSIGTVEYRQQKQTVSVGIFGHVFTKIPEKAKEAIRKEFL